MIDNDVLSIESDINGVIWIGTSHGLSRLNNTSWTNYTITDGPKHDNIISIAIDKNGTIWFAPKKEDDETSNLDGYGVISFDGTTWNTYTKDDGLSDNNVRSIAVDNDNNIWFATPYGASKYDGTEWKTYTEFDGLISNNVTTVNVDKKGDMWFGTVNGVSVFDGTSWDHYTDADGLKTNCVGSIAFGDSITWFTNYEYNVLYELPWNTEGQGVTGFDGETWISFHPFDSKVHAVAVDTNGISLFGTHTCLSSLHGKIWTVYTCNRIYTYDGNTGLETKEEITWGDGILRDRVYAIGIDDNNVKWFGTGYGLTRYDNATWNTWTESDGLANNKVTALAIDPTGVKWIGTYQGISRFVDRENNPNLKLLFPNGGELLKKGNSEVIRWIKGDANLIKIEFSSDNGKNWKIITGNTNASSEAYTWTIPEIDSEQCQIKITSLNDKNVSDISDDFFTISKDGSGESPILKYRQWTTLTNMNNINYLYADGDYILSATTGGVVKINIADGMVNKIYTTSDGLGSNRINAVVIDNNGTMWFGTENGISRYNGTTWDSSAIPEVGNSNVSSLATDSDGVLWVGTYYGEVASYDGNQWKTHITDDAYENGYTPAIKSIVFDCDNVLWLAKYSSGVMCFDGTTWKTYTPEDGLATNNVNAIAVDDNGVKWFCTDGGVSKFNGTDWQNYRISSGLIDNTVNAVAVDIDGVLWFGTAKGVSSFDGSTWTNYKTSDGLAYDNVSSVAIDKYGVKWFGMKDVEPWWSQTVYPGISSFDGTIWKTHYNPGPIDNRILCIDFKENGTAWIGTENGLSNFNGSNWNSYKKIDGLLDNEVSAIEVDKNNVKWIGYDHEGVSSYDGSTFKHYKGNGLDHKKISSIAADDNGVIWIGGMGNGVHRFDGTTWDHFSFETSGLLNDHIPSIDIDNNGIVWFGTWVGLSGYDGTRWTTIEINNSSSNRNDRIYAFSIGPNNIKWAGTEVREYGYDYSLTSIDGKDRKVYKKSNGYPVERIVSIEVDDNGVVWAGTEYAGITKYDGVSWTTYNKSDGLVHENVRSIGIDPDGVKWIGTTQGISRFDDRQQNPILQVITPNGGEQLLSGSKKTIRWGIGEQQFLTIEYSLNNGATWDIIDDNVDASTLAYDWIVPEIESDECLIKISDKENNNFVDQSDKQFIISSKISVEDFKPIEFALFPNQPNPFNPSTTINFSLPISDFTSLVIYNIMGQKVRELIADDLQAGAHSFVWDGRNDRGMVVSSGLYLSRLRSGKHTATVKMLLMK